MPRVDIANAATYNGPAENDKFPTVKLTKNEKARLIYGLEKPWAEWAHPLRAPKIVNGEPVITPRKRQDGTMYEEMEKVFIGNPFCLGEGNMLATKGVDADHCPACAASLSSDAVAKPVCRFAVNVVKYKVNQQTGQPVIPFGGEILVWTLTQKRYNQLKSLEEEWGDLRRHDIKLGPCEDANYQKYNIEVGSEAYWLASEDSKRYVTLLWQTPGNRATDDQLRDHCGRQSTYEFLQSDVSRCEQLYRMAHNAGAQALPATLGAEFAGGAVSLEAGLDALLDTPAVAPVAAAPAVHPGLAAAQAQSADPFAELAQPAVAVPTNGAAASLSVSAPMAAPASLPAAPATPVDPFAELASIPGVQVGAAPAAMPLPHSAPAAAPVAAVVPAPVAPAAAAVAAPAAPAAQPKGEDISFDDLFNV